MRPMMLGPAEKELLADLYKRATENRISWKQLTAHIDGEGPNPFYDFTIKIPVGLTIAYTIEVHEVGVFRHLSVQLDDSIERIPSPHAVMLLMEELGFKKSLYDCKIIPQDAPNGSKIINVFEMIEKRSSS